MSMMPSIPRHKYAALAELRFRIREFVVGSDGAAKSAFLEPQQYQMLLALYAIPEQIEPSIRCLAERLFLKHHSVVGLVDRLESRGYVRRIRSVHDKRQVLVVLLPRGRRALDQVVRQRLHELQEGAHALISALEMTLSEPTTRKKIPRVKSRRP
jgi:DNA-binding MarR family transcriptional regulator